MITFFINRDEVISEFWGFTVIHTLITISIQYTVMYVSGPLQFLRPRIIDFYILISDGRSQKNNFHKV